MPNESRTPSQRLQLLIEQQAWTDTTMLDLLFDFLDSHAREASTFLAYVEGRAEQDADDEDEPERAEAGQSVDDLDRLFGIQRATSGDLFAYNDVSARPIEHVWTIVEGEGNTLWAQPGFHVVNRQGYITTERPWVTGVEEFRFDD